ncbi:cytochrome c-type biogenesis protein [Paraburkholderia bonniea]|uniref:cytochrome c-type biogenesis protein n=1 Tax=Paraburkholderia bonniea TaxID=2152891 RepID=UPI0012911911|nr:cytochrome c-type biogenesis protein [Paraburkholderia bonniea]
MLLFLQRSERRCWLAALVALAGLLGLSATPAWAWVPASSSAQTSLVNAGLPSPAVDARVRQLAARLRCLVCQNQTLADSNADLAADLRDKIRQQVQQGATDAQIEAYMVQRYGDFVLYQPPLKPVTWVLWFGPFVALVLAAVLFWRGLVRRRARQVPQTLDVAERQHAERLLETFDQDSNR